MEEITFQLSTFIDNEKDNNYPNTINIDILDENKRQNKIVGKVIMRTINCIDAENFFDTCDDCSDKLFKVAENVTRLNKNGYSFKRKEFDEFSDFIIITEIGLDKDYRGMGIMMELFDALDKYFKYSVVYLLHAAPITYEHEKFDSMEYNDEYEVIRTKLIKAYKKTGFKLIGKNTDYMYKILY
jgi:GNAT superfamily N-acetyltransferase